MRRARSARVSLLVLYLAGDATAAAARGVSAQTWKTLVLARHAEASGWPSRLVRAEDELKDAGLWPWAA